MRKTKLTFGALLKVARILKQDNVPLYERKFALSMFIIGAKYYKI